MQGHWVGGLVSYLHDFELRYLVFCFCPTALRAGGLLQGDENASAGESVNVATALKSNWRHMFQDSPLPGIGMSDNANPAHKTNLLLGRWQHEG